MVWSNVFRFDSTVNGKAIEIASILDEGPQVGAEHVVERSLTDERVVEELIKVFATAGWRPP